MKLVGFVHTYTVTELLRILNENVPFPSHTLLSNLDEIVVRFDGDDDKYFQQLSNLLNLAKNQKIKVCFLTNPIENPEKLLKLYKSIPFSLCLDNTRHQTVDYLQKFDKMFQHIPRSIFTRIYREDQEYYVMDNSIMITNPMVTITQDIQFTYKEHNCMIVLITSENGKKELLIHNQSKTNNYVVKKKKIAYELPILPDQITLKPDELFVLQL